MTAVKEYGIAVFHHIGDVLCCTPIAKQLKANDANCRITWFTSVPGEVAIRHNPFIDEIIVLEGDQYALDHEIPALAKIKNWTRFFAPAAYLNYEAIPGGSILYPKGTIFGIVKAGAQLQWTVPFTFPFVLTAEEKSEANQFWSNLPAGKKILVETDYRSEQSPWRDRWNDDLLQELRDVDPVFVFTAKERPPFFDRFKTLYPKAVWCNLPFRLNAELFNLCDAFVGVSSGISCLTYSEYCRTDIPRIEVTRGEHWGAAELPHHENLFLCYSHTKFIESLQRLRGLILEHDFKPNFEPRVAPSVRLQGMCPSCSERNTQGVRGEDIRQCRSCGAIFSSLAQSQATDDIQIELHSDETLALTPGEFVAEEGFHRGEFHSATIAGDLGSVTRLRELIEKLQFVLCHDGLLCLSAPNFEEVLSASLGFSWKDLKPEQTLWYFTPLQLRELIIQAGFWIEHWETRTPGESGETLRALIGKARGDLQGVELDRFIDEINRRGGGDLIRIRARKRGDYKGRGLFANSADAPVVKLQPTQVHANAPLVTVVVPCFNQGSTLEDAVRSIGAQTYKNVETLVVNDGSSDDTPAIAEALATKYPACHIRIIHSAHCGTAEARDLGFAEAKGEWFIPLDSDDELMPEFVASAVSKAGGTTDAALVYSRQKQFGLGSRLWDPGPFQRDHILRGIFPPSTVLMARSFFYQFGGFNTGNPFGCSHYHMWLSAAEHRCSVAYIPETLVKFRIERNGQAHHQTNAHWKLALALYESLHPKLFPATHLKAQHAIIAQSAEYFAPVLAEHIAKFPGNWVLYFWRGLISEAAGLFEQALHDYALSEVRCPDLNWQPGWKKLSLEVKEFGQDRLLLLEKERELFPTAEGASGIGSHT